MGWRESLGDDRRIVPGRSCGDCTACCVWLRIDELDKPPGVPCRNLAPGGGCGIHPDRPEVCRRFFCHWMTDPELGDDWRPDRAGFLIAADRGRMRLNVVPDPDRPDAWEAAPWRDTLRGWAMEGFFEGLLVIVSVGGQARAVLPDREEPLGTLTKGSRVSTTMEMDAGGAPRFGVRVEPPEAED